VLHTTMTIVGPSDIYHCELSSIQFDAQEGSPVTGLVSTNQSSSIGVYILTDAEYYDWTSGSTYCDSVAHSEWSSGSHATMATVNWTPQFSGTYWLTVESWVGGNNYVSIMLRSPSVQTMTSIQYSFETVTHSFATTQTITFEQTQQLTEMSSTGNNVDLSAVSIIVVASMAIVVVIVLMRKRKEEA